MATYAELRNQIQEYTEYSETRFVNNIPSFIRRAEERIFYWVQIPAFKQNVLGNVTPSNRYLQLPTGFKASFSLRVVDGDYLINKDVNFMREAYPGNVQGAPRYYGLFDENTILIAPVPDQAYQMELHYAYEPPSLTAGPDSGTTWLSTNAEDALLYGSLVQGYIFMKGEQDLIDEYESQFSFAINRLKNLGEARDRKDTYRGGELKKPEN